MSERKKYYPPDFDGSKIPRGLQVLGRAAKEIRKRPRQITIRLMAPMSMRCNTCGEYIYKGKKFNARQETVKNEDYLGLRIYRFYIKCPCCVSEITFKTDPANTDYAMEAGATRSFQAARIAEKQEELRREQEEEEEKTNPMQALEKRTRESRREMEKLEHLEELRDLNRRQISVDHDSMLNIHLSKPENMTADQDDDRLVKEIFYMKDKNTEEDVSEENLDTDAELAKQTTHKFTISKITGVNKITKPLVKVTKKKDASDIKPNLLVGPYSSTESDESA